MYSDVFKNIIIIKIIMSTTALLFTYYKCNCTFKFQMPAQKQATICLRIRVMTFQHLGRNIHVYGILRYAVSITNAI
jgi:hypothetical protein